NILVKLFISEIVHTEDSFLLKLYYKFNFATEPTIGFNKLEKWSLVFIIFTFLSSLALLYFKYNFSSVMPVLSLSILTILILLTSIITVVSVNDEDT
ncbi:hypothetical protein, partial [Staphylococcus aureus]|uniref:hypothetical protein n=1 Tax=Staphylococcus aureus TaxID=1280 RepID=UPI00044C2B5B